MERTLKIIEGLRTMPCLWDVTSENFKNRFERRIAMKTLSQTYQLPLEVMEKKIRNLKSQFWREHKKVVESIKNDRVIHYSWYGYRPLQFLTRGIETRVKEYPEGIPTFNDVNHGAEENLDGRQDDFRIGLLSSRRRIRIPERRKYCSVKNVLRRPYHGEGDISSSQCGLRRVAGAPALFATNLLHTVNKRMKYPPTNT